MFQPHLLVADDNTLILLNKIESIKPSRSEEDETLDKLKGDMVITVTTVSGKEYDISMKHLQAVYGEYHSIPLDVLELRTIIIENWIKLNTQE